MNKNKLLHVCLVFVILFASLALSPAVGQSSQTLGTTIYVDIDATGNNDGSSWHDAFTNLQPAMDAATSGDQVWVAAGTYLPTVQHCGSGVRYKSFQLKKGVAIYGGFDPSAGDVGWTDRDWEANVTITSGDIGVPGDSSDNSYHVFCHPGGLSLEASAKLDGLTIQKGNASLASDPDGMGGGMFNQGSSPTLANVIISDNSAYLTGGGMFNRSASPILINVTFTNNYVGMYNTTSSSPELTDVIFDQNYIGMVNSYSSPTLNDVTFSNNDGDGMNNYYSSPSLINVTFSDNFGDGGMVNQNSSPTLLHVTFSNNVTTLDAGGGMNNSNSNPTLEDVTFINNTAQVNGGGMYNSNSSPTLTDVTFSGNWAQYGGGMYNSSSSPVLKFVDFTGNTAQLGAGMYNEDASLPTLENVSFSQNLSEYGTCSGMYNDSSSPTLNGVTFAGNLVSYGTAGMCNGYSSPVLTNVTFSGNQGSGMSNDNSSPSLTNVTFSGNLVSGIANAYSTPSLTNCILWGDSGSEIYNDNSIPIVSYSDVQGGYEGTGNIDADPLLGPLQDNGGYVFTHALGAGSPAIDAGNPDPATCPELDARDNFRPIGGDGDGTPRCDMGAYEFGQLNLLPVAYLPVVSR